MNLTFDTYTEGLTHYTTQAERDRVEWLWGYLVNVLGKNLDALRQELGVEHCTIDNILRGGLMVTGSAREEVWEAVDALKRKTERQKPLVRTVVTQRVLDALDRCRDESTMVYITGATGRGKTYSAEYWASQNNHGRTHFLRIPSDCTRRMLILLLAQSFGLSVAGAIGDKQLALMRYITARHVIICDEAGHLLSKSGRPRGPIEFLRDLHDATHCGVALIFTDVYLNEMRHGASADYFEQFFGRLEFPVEIPAQPRRDEVRSIIRAFVPDASESFVDYALTLARRRDGKLRTLFKDLYQADDFAKSKGHKMTIDDLKKIVAFRLSGGAWPEDR